MTERSDRTNQIMESIRGVLFRDWDPIGVSGDDEWPTDEYDAYVRPVYRILAGSRSEDELIRFLYKTEKRTIGVNCGDPEKLRPIAKELLELRVEL